MCLRRSLGVDEASSDHALCIQQGNRRTHAWSTLSRRKMTSSDRFNSEYYNTIEFN